MKIFLIGIYRLTDYLPRIITTEAIPVRRIVKFCCRKPSKENLSVYYMHRKGDRIRLLRRMN
jgi:hypothetical protein